MSNTTALKDRGIYSRKNSSGQIVWYVRCGINGQMHHFGGFSTRLEALTYYDHVKRDQRRRRLTTGSHANPQASIVLPHHADILFGEVIYFVECIPNGPIKIGYSRKLSKRLLALQSQNGTPTRFLGAIPGTLADELALHARFKPTRDHHEWYVLSEELADYLFGLGMQPSLDSITGPAGSPRL